MRLFVDVGPHRNVPDVPMTLLPSLALPASTCGQETACTIFGDELPGKMCAKSVEAEQPQVGVEVIAMWLEHNHRDTGCTGALGQCRHRMGAGRIIVACDIEALQYTRKGNGSEMRGGKTRDHCQWRDRHAQ